MIITMIIIMIIITMVIITNYYDDHHYYRYRYTLMMMVLAARIKETSHVERVVFRPPETELRVLRGSSTLFWNEFNEFIRGSIVSKSFFYDANSSIFVPVFQQKLSIAFDPGPADSIGEISNDFRGNNMPS